jgi:hypothetical protein
LCCGIRSKGDDRLAQMTVLELFLLVLAAYILFVNNNIMDESTDIVLSALFISESSCLPPVSSSCRVLPLAVRVP